MIQDRNIDYRYRHRFIHVANFNSFVGGIGGGDDIASIIDNAALIAAVGTTHSGMLTVANNDAAQFSEPIPGDLDLNHPIFVRVIYSDAGGGGTVQWTIKTGAFSFGAVVTAAGSLNPIDSPIQSDTSTGGSAVDATQWGKIAGGSMLQGGTPDCWVVNANQGNAGTRATTLMGIELAYLPKFTDGSQSNDNVDPTDA